MQINVCSQTLQLSWLFSGEHNVMVDLPSVRWCFSVEPERVCRSWREEQQFCSHCTLCPNIAVSEPQSEPVFVRGGDESYQDTFSLVLLTPGMPSCVLVSEATTCTSILRLTIIQRTHTHIHTHKHTDTQTQTHTHTHTHTHTVHTRVQRILSDKRRPHETLTTLLPDR